jgi:4-amino-4-deoxy-L-arabinose transferase-like glycosyltransferase
MFKNIVVLIFILAVLLPGINKPFIGHHDWNGVYYSNIGRNYLRYGLATKLGQVTNFGSISQQEFNFYTHYPPLFPLLLAADFKIFGVSDVSARMLPLVLTALSFVLIIKIAGSLAPLLLLFTPMIRYFSHMPSQEALMVFLVLAIVYFYQLKNSRGILWSVAALGLSGWAGYFLIPLLWLHAKIYRPKLIPVIGKTLLVLGATFGLHLLHTWWLTGSFFGGGLIDALLLRLNLNPLLGRPEPELSGQFTLFNYLNKEFHTLNIYYTSSLLLLAAVGGGRIVLEWWQKRRLNDSEGMIVALLLWGLSYPLIFSNVTFVHEYFNLFFWPGLALLATHSINFLAKIRSRRTEKKLVWLLLLVATMAIAKERLPFLVALQASQAHRPGYELGLNIKGGVPQGLTLRKEASEEFVDSQGIFVGFYADRQIIWEQSDEKNN